MSACFVMKKVLVIFVNVYNIVNGLKLNVWFIRWKIQISYTMITKPLTEWEVSFTKLDLNKQSEK